MRIFIVARRVELVPGSMSATRLLAVHYLQMSGENVSLLEMMQQIW